jgi:hypothetical protein
MELINIFIYELLIPTFSRTFPICFNKKMKYGTLFAYLRINKQ